MARDLASMPPEELLNNLVPVLFPPSSREYLEKEGVVFVFFCDLPEVPAFFDGGRAVLLRRGVAKSAEGEATFSAEELVRRAERNALRLLPPVCTPMISFLHGTVPEGEGEDLFVVTNGRNSRGASAVCCPGVLEDLRERMGKDFYLLPSSIHEMIAVPVLPGTEPAKLREMVAEINRTVVDPEEVLSDSVYVYEKAAGRVRMVS